MTSGAVSRMYRYRNLAKHRMEHGLCVRCGETNDSHWQQCESCRLEQRLNRLKRIK